MTMTAQEIKDMINQELKAEPDIHNVFGLDLAKCLIEPIKQKYKDSNDSADIYELWTVLEEADGKSGYKIYFDEKSKMFGLGIASNLDELIDIGNYGTFLQTLYSM
jgi:hypothetical protein